MFLGELCFLEGSRNSDKAVYVDQALWVRPFDGSVLFHAGREAWLAGDEELRKRLAATAGKSIQQYSWDERGRRIFRLVKEICEERNGSR